MATVTAADTPLRSLGRRSTIVVLVAASLALLLSAYLTVVSFTQGSPHVGCGAGDLLDCDHVLRSKWSRLGGVPVSLLATFWYAGVIAAVATMRRLPDGRRLTYAWWTLIVLAIGIASAAIWFTALQAGVLNRYCPFCMLTHLGGAIVAITILVAAPISYRWRRPRALMRIQSIAHLSAASKRPESTTPGLYLQHLTMASLLGVTMVAVLAVGQVFTKERTFEIHTFQADLAKHDDQAKSKPSPASIDDLLPASAKPVNVPEDTNQIPIEPAPARPDDVDSLFPDEPRATPTNADDPPLLDPKPPQTASTDVTAPANPGGSDTAAALSAVDREIKILDGTVKLSMLTEMVIGPPNAKHVVVKLFDYSCPHCRNLHRQLDELVREYDGELCVIVLPVPLNVGCNPAVQVTHEKHTYACLYARLAIAVWRNDPQAFREFHHWLFEPFTPPGPGAARDEAARLVGQANLERELAGEDVDKHISHAVNLFQQCSAGSLPKLILGDAIFVGETKTFEELRVVLEKHNIRATSAPSP